MTCGNVLDSWRAGDVIENPVTGETITFLRTSEDTGGAQLEIELLLRPNAFLPAAHVHPTQEEAFPVLEGAVRFTAGARRVLPAWTHSALLRHLLRPRSRRQGQPQGLANPIRMAQMARTYDVYLAAAPVAVQRPVFAALDLVGRVLGHPRMPV